AVSLDGPSRAGVNLYISGLDSTLPIRLTGRIVSALFQTNPYITISLNNELLRRFIPEPYYTTGTFNIPIPRGAIREGVNLVNIEQSAGAGARALVDYITIFYGTFLDRTGFFFTPYREGVIALRAQRVDDPWFFEVTHHNSVKWERNSSIVINTDTSPRRFVLTSFNSMKTLSSPIEEYFPQPSDIPDLWSENNSADCILILPDAYYDVAQELVQHLLRRQDSSIRAVRVRLSEIYNRFSGGLKDPAAIRNMLHYAVEFWDTPPRYVIFCGDGDYNYRDIDRPTQPHQVPPYEMGSLCSDDWFSDFTPFDSDRVREPLPELVHGRLTAQTVGEFRAMIEKIVAYEETPEFGLWRNRVTLVADDEFGEVSSTESEHIRGTEDLSARYLPAYLERLKIYLTEYNRQWGRSKPQAGKDLVDIINRGTLLVNYMGHGNPTLWAHEHVFVL
ncbi:MAG: C25 family cysteine peptidase, partial [bacterium]